MGRKDIEICTVQEVLVSKTRQMKIEWKHCKINVNNVIYDTYGQYGIHVCKDKPYLYVQGCKQPRMITLSRNYYSLLIQVINQYFQNKLFEQQYEKIMYNLGGKNE